MTKDSWAKWPPHPAESAGTYARTFSENELAAGDVARNKLKNSGQTLQREIDRGLAREIQERHATDPSYLDREYGAVAK